MMRVLVYADFRSPHAQGWADGLREAGIEVVTLSSHTASPSTAGHDQAHDQPLDALSRARAAAIRRLGRRGADGHGLLGRLRKSQLLHTGLAALRVRGERQRLRAVIDRSQPDVVHALRLPYEGLVLLGLSITQPKIVSTWGQDFVLQAQRDPVLRWWIRRRLAAADGLHVDNPADVARAHASGFEPGRPTLHAAGNFGVDTELFHPGPKDPGLVLCGRRPSLNIDTEAFIQLIQHTSSGAGIQFAMIGLAEDDPRLAPVRSWVASGQLHCYPSLDRDKFAELVRSARVVVSPSTSDGMPNTVLEALASGCQVVAGDLDQLRPLAARESRLHLVDLSQPSELIQKVFELVDKASDASRESLAVQGEYSRAANAFRVPAFYRAVVTQAGKCNRW